MKVIRTALKGGNMWNFFGWMYSGTPLLEFRVAVSQNNVQQHRASPTVSIVACLFCAEEQKT